MPGVAGEPDRRVTATGVTAVAVNVVAGAVLLLAWYRAADAVRVPDQLVWLNLGVVAVSIAVAVDAIVVVAGRRALAVRRMALTVLVGEPRDGSPVTEDAQEAPDAEPDPMSPVVVDRPGTTRYHRPGCHLVAGKPVRTVEPTEPLHPCGMCRP